MTDTVLNAATESQQTTPHETPAPRPDAGAPDWRQHIPEAIRGEKTWEKHKDIGSALQSLHHLEKKLGSAINVPGQKATPEEIATYREKIGVPKESKDYKFDHVKLPGEAKWDEAGMGEFNSVAHTLGLTPAQHQGLLEYYGGSLGKVQDGSAKEFAEGEAALKTEWGAKFDENLALSGIGLLSYDPKGAFKAALSEAGLANDPRVLRYLQAVGSEVGEDHVTNGENKDIMTKEEAELKLKAIDTDQSHPLHIRKDPKHQDAVKEYGELLKLAV